MIELSSGASLIEFRCGDRPVLFPRVFPDLLRPSNLESIARANGLHLLWIREPDRLFADRWDEARLEQEYASNRRLREFYADILDLQRRHVVPTVLFLGDGGYWHREFLAALKRQSVVALWTADDPEGSSLTSKPFVRCYDFAFCGGVYYSATTRISEQFLRWGAANSQFIPLGACPDKFLPQGDRSDDDFFSRERDIDVIYVGAAVRAKLWRILTIKRYFRDRFLLAGRRWNGRGLGWKGIAVRLLTAFCRLGQIREVSDAELVGLYQRSRIGFNCHLSYGPSNIRCYELPLNGVMQVCDCGEGLSELFAPFREVVPYDTTPDAIAQIEHYLIHEDERATIARAGHRRALKEYTMEHSFRRLFAAIDAKVRRSTVTMASSS